MKAFWLDRSILEWLIVLRIEHLLVRSEIFETIDEEMTRKHDNHQNSMSHHFDEDLSTWLSNQLINTLSATNSRYKMNITWAEKTFQCFKPKKVLSQQFFDLSINHSMVYLDSSIFIRDWFWSCNTSYQLMLQIKPSFYNTFPASYLFRQHLSLQGSKELVLRGMYTVS